VKILADLKRDGFSFYPRLLVELATAQVANILGSTANLSQLLPESGIPVQTLVPRETNEAGLNQYSGNFGLAEFPLHSDLAHWALPPRYFMLRCIVGAMTSASRVKGRSDGSAALRINHAAFGVTSEL
jgi:L-asparagine oxygenase